MLRQFTDFGAASRGNITLRVNRGIFISNAILNKLECIDAKFVNLFIDDERCLIGMIFIKNKTDGASRKLSIEKSGFSFCATPLLRVLGIKILKQKTTFEYKIKDDMLIIDLSSVKKEM